MTTIAVLLLALVVTLLPALPGSLSGSTQVAATPEEVKWERVSIPNSGEAGGWVLAPGSDVRHLTVAQDGTLFAYANPSGTSYTLYKFANGGRSWSSTGGVQDTIVGLATAPDDASIVYYATVSSIHRSTDAGKSFSPLPPGPGGAGTGNITISSFDIARLNGKSIIVVGTIDSDTGQYGGVYTLDESKPLPGWENGNIGSFDVAAVAVSPNYVSDRQLVAVVTNEQDTLVTTRLGSGGWNQIIGNATIRGIAATSAAIAFPDGYDAINGNYTQFVAISANNSGNVFRIRSRWVPDGSIADNLNIGADYNLNQVAVSGLAVSGNASAARLLAGAAGSTQVYISPDGGASWTRSTKEPTGRSRTHLLMARDFARSGIAYAATSGTGSAFSYTSDGGLTWNQLALVDTRIGNNGIIDLAVSPAYGSDNTLFMLTFDDTSLQHSLWRSRNGGEGWERVLSSTLPHVDSLARLELSPGYGKGNRTVFLAGSSDGNPAIYKSSDGGQVFKYHNAPLPVDVWLVVDDNTLFLGSYNGTSGLVYTTASSGYLYSPYAAVGSQQLHSIALSPDYPQDRAILIGNTNGWVYYSSDNGSSFKPLPSDAASPPLNGSITVAFDPHFSSNRIVYAASDSANKGIYRFVLNRSTRWERIDSTLSAGSTISQLAVSTGGTLYAINSQTVNATANRGGMERSLKPADLSGSTFETVTRGLDDGVNLSGLWLRGNQMWAIDTRNTRLMTFVDSLAEPVTLTSPADKYAGRETKNIVLEWKTLKGATEYQWQLDYDTDFSAVPQGFGGNTSASSARLPPLDAETTYYWRVRATKPMLSPWSAGRSFTTGTGSALAIPALYSPEAGATGTSTRPLFQWSAVAGADSYELIVSPDVYFDKPVIEKAAHDALPATAWQSDVSLDYNTAYYWKVRASGSDTWSAVGAFITEPPPAQPSAPPASLPPRITAPPQPVATSPPPATSPPAQGAFPDWFPYLTGALLLAIVVLLATMLVVMMRRR